MESPFRQFFDFINPKIVNCFLLIWLYLSYFRKFNVWGQQFNSITVKIKVLVCDDYSGNHLFFVGETMKLM